MTDLQQTREMGPRKKRGRCVARVRQLGAAEVGETALLCAIFDLHERLLRLLLACRPARRRRRLFAAIPVFQFARLPPGLPARGAERDEDDEALG